MRKILLAGLLIVLLTGAAGAGDSLLWGIYGGLDIQPLIIDMSGMNSFLRPAGIHRFSPVAPAIGWNLQLVLQQNFHLILEGHTFLLYEGGKQSDVSFAGGYYTLSVGYDAIATPCWRLRPELGVGLSSLNFVLDGVTGRYQGIGIPNGDDNLTFNRNAWLGRLGLTAEWTPILYHKENGLIGMVWSLTVGGYAPLTTEAWSITAGGDAGDIDAYGKGPRTQMFGGFVSLGVRFGGGITATN
jgi:hypothetical protein